jgi:hypothetical protein
MAPLDKPVGNGATGQARREGRLGRARREERHFVIIFTLFRKL